MNIQNKTIFDLLHGYIEIDSEAIKIIDCKEFQRLRNIKQLGVVHLVFPSATHTRFEHSLGVYHLCSELLKCLRINTPNLSLTEREEQLIKIGALCHDLGHGPFSHLLDNTIYRDVDSKYKEHENRSCLILGYINEKYKLGYNLEEIEFISDIIHPDEKKLDLPNNPRSFIYEIVANFRNGIDVDKFDYIKRDTFYCGLNYTIDCSRIIRSVKVIGNKLCYLDKSYKDIQDIFYVRGRLHNEIFRHHTCISIDKMVEYILFILKDYLKLIVNINNPKEFCRINDNILDYIENINIKDIEELFREDILKAKNVILKIRNRNLEKLGNKILPNFITKTKINLSNIYFYNKKDLQKSFNY